MFKASSQRFLYLTSVVLAKGVHPQQPASHRVKGLPRLHGIITGFKNRRGYGFVVAHGTVGVPPANLPVPLDRLLTKYFFTRASLSGGFRVNEGDHVSFEVWGRKGALPLLVSGSGSFGEASSPSGGYVPLHESVVEPVVTSKKAELPDDGMDSDGQLLHLAMRMRFYNIETKVESPITPTTLCGKVIKWDPIEGRGVVSELDMDGNFHYDAPCFELTLDETDLAPGTELRVGRYVKFCVDEEDGRDDTGGSLLTPSMSGKGGGDMAPAASVASGGTQPAGSAAPLRQARAAIIDRAAERKNAVVGVPLVPASAPCGSVNELTRFSGTIRMVEENFGFVTDDLEGDSIFFHMTNASSQGLQEGERVTYLLRMINFGKHAGKKACFDVRRVKNGEDPRELDQSSMSLTRSLHDDDEIDFLD
ncbi:unnamed protein product [Phytomonas sp. EM1]|nr:unnamed protein product [Phytomonas sp. EM1]|eukprot:CCW64267.1 unnamed protein product [Phytomonas sp. isolate EM1]